MFHDAYLFKSIQIFIEFRFRLRYIEEFNLIEEPPQSAVKLRRVVEMHTVLRVRDVNQSELLLFDPLLAGIFILIQPPSIKRQNSIP